MKYVIFEGNGTVQPVLFAEHTTHLQVTVAGAKPVSAGFVQITHGGAKCFGRSDSLNLDSRGEIDANIIDRMLIDMPTSTFLIL